MRAALSAIAGSVDANLIANRLQGWKHEADATCQLADEVSREPALRTELDPILEKLEVFGQGRQALADAERPWLTGRCGGNWGNLAAPPIMKPTSRAPVPLHKGLERWRQAPGG
jgi:hypothetical protein